MDQVSTKAKENPRTAATVQGQNMKTNIHGGLKMNPKVSPENAPVTITEDLEQQFPQIKKPRGWKVDKESRRLFGITEATGPKFSVADGGAGAWVTWEEGVGVYFTLDTSDSTMFTIEEMREYHAHFGQMLAQVEKVLAA